MKKSNKISKQACADCIHARFEPESWEMPHLGSWVCLRRPKLGEDWRFPYMNTKCKLWVSKWEGKTTLQEALGNLK